MRDMYKEVGVSSSKEAVHAATKNNSKGLYPYSFCKIEQMRGLPNWANFLLKLTGNEMVEISHADGAGTKSSLAYIYWREFNDMSVWHGVVQDSIVMNLDDVACVGGMTGQMHLTSNIDRNSFNIPDRVIAELINGENKFLEKMRKFGVDNITGQVGETADVPDLTQTIVINNSLHCTMKRSDVIDNGKIDAGDLIVGLSSYGQSFYEDYYNGGMGSNGLTLGRHGVFSKYYAENYPESYDHHNLGFEKAYRGKTILENQIDIGNGKTVHAGKLVLSPTRTYAPIIKKIHNAGIGPKEISGMVHCSGGGQTKVLNYLSKPLNIIKDSMFTVPPLFKLIQSETGATWKEMYKDFNMGHRMEIYTKNLAIAQEIIRISTSLGVEAKIIGHVVKNNKDSNRNLRIQSPLGVFEYSKER